jgi:hypothetical protein
VQVDASAFEDGPEVDEATNGQAALAAALKARFHGK